jgi:phenylpropionate dioxygenase-like ring-hydroxylating dioxygenase large terminal subunit
LQRLPKVEAFAGFIFGSFDADVPPLEEFLGNAAPYLELVAAQGGEGIRLSAGAHHLTYGANWKLQVENTIDNYHFGFVHRSFLEVLADRIGEPPPIMRNVIHNPEWRTLDLGNGHSVHEFGDPRTGNNQGQLGDLPFNLIVFPNLCFVGAQLRHVLPKAVDRTDVLLYPMLHEGKSDEENARILRTHEGFYGPAGMGGVDDIEVAFDRVSDGMRAVENDWLVMSRGAHREEPGENGTLIGHSADELPQRAFYREWQRRVGRPS